MLFAFGFLLFVINLPLPSSSRASSHGGYSAGQFLHVRLPPRRMRACAPKFLLLKFFSLPHSSSSNPARDSTIYFCSDISQSSLDSKHTPRPPPAPQLVLS